MVIVGMIANTFTAGGVNNAGGGSITHNFAPSSVWGTSTLQAVFMNADDGFADTFVSKYVDASGTHKGAFIGVFAKKCTSITYSLKTTDCIARPLCVTELLLD